MSEIYHENTKDRERVIPASINAPSTTGPWYRAFKKYPHRPRTALAICEPGPSTTAEEAMRARRSTRQFRNEPLSLDQLGRLLYFSNGITGTQPLDQGTLPLRASPSAGALYPIELYVAAFSVEGLQEGIYHFEVEDNVLELLRPGLYKQDLFEITHRQEMVLQSAVVVLMSAVFGRTRNKYGERGYRYVLLDAGHLAQNLYLESTALGLGCATIGGFFDDKANNLLGIDGVDESVVYMAVIGS
jgi:SagB-type dehydrogenase family enzyme